MVYIYFFISFCLFFLKHVEKQESKRTPISFSTRLRDSQSNVNSMSSLVHHDEYSFSSTSYDQCDDQSSEVDSLTSSSIPSPVVCTIEFHCTMNRN